MNDVASHKGLRAPVASEGEVPLSYAQQSLWFMAQLVPDHPFYNLPSALILRGPLDLDALAQTFGTLVKRHEALRTVFPARAGRPVQIVQPAAEPEVPLVKVGGADRDERWAKARALASEEGMRPFDLSAGPLLRVMVLQVEPQEHLLVFTMHHIASDGWSIAVMSREIPLLYDGYCRGEAPALPPLPMQYADYARWQRDWLGSGKLEPGLAYWRQRLEGIEPLRLPTDRPRPAIQSHRGATQYIEIPTPLRDRLEALAHAEGMTLFMVLLAGFHVLMGRYCDQRQTLVGTPMANRERHEVEGLIGFFANSMVLPCDLRGSPGFREVLARVRQETLAAYEHREVPFELLVEHLNIPRDPARNPIFQVMFALQKSSVSEIVFPGLEVEALNLDNSTTHFDMEWHLWNRDSGLGGYVSYSVDLFEPATIARLCGHFIAVLEAVVADPGAPIEQIDLLLAPERKWLSERAAAERAPAEAPGVLSRLSERAAEASGPALVALGDAEVRTWTATRWHAEVGRVRACWSGQVTAGARALWRARSTPEALTAALAAWSLGLVVVPVDAGAPDAALAERARECDARWILGSAADEVGSPEGVQRLAWPEGSVKQGEVTEVPVPPADATALCLRLGEQWVRLTHAALAERCAGLARSHALKPGERFAFVGLGAGAALVESMVALVAGATLVVPPPEATEPERVGAVLGAEPTHLLLTPERLEGLADDGQSHPALRRVRTVICGGGLPAPELLATFGSRVGVTLHASYAPPEVVVPLGPLRASERGTLVLEGDPGAGVTIVDDHGRPVPIGVVGRICVRQEACVDMPSVACWPDPFDPERRLVATGERGRWHVNARAEGQLELWGPDRGTLWWRGERVSLDEIASALLRHPAVAEAVVVARRGAATWWPVAAVGLQRPTHEAQLRTACAERSSVVPAAWMMLARLPRDDRGEVALRRLESLPVIDRGAADRWQDAINAQVGVKQARVLRREAKPAAALHHVGDLVPGWQARRAPVSDEGGERTAGDDDRTAWDALPRAYADGGPLSLPPQAPATLVEALLRTAEAFPQRGVRCLQEAGDEVFVPYPELLRRARCVLAGLREAGLGPGDRVILQVARLADHFACFWGCVLAGVVPVTVAVPSMYGQRNSVVNKLWNTWTLLRGPYVLHSESLGAGLAGVPALFESEGPAPFPYRTLRAEALLAQEPAHDHHPASPDDVVFYQLTSGSTGVPKCIQETHAGIVHHIHGSRVFNGYTAEDVTLNWLPMDHVVPILTCHLKDTYLGISQIHVQPSVVLAEPLRWLDLMAEHRVTHTWCPNFGFKLVCDSLAQAPERTWDLRCLKFAMNAGEQVTLSVVSDWLRRLAPFGVEPQVMQPSFGMAEACTCMTYCNDFTTQSGAFWVDKASLGGLLKEAEPGPGAMSFIDLGPVMPGVEIRITDADNQVVPEGVIGRFQIRGRVITPGYLHNDEANREAFVGDGWFNSGDLGFIKGGRLALTGREKEIIIIRGANFYCYEIEGAVGGIEGVEPTFSAAIAVQDPATGSETLAVFFVPRAGADALDGALVQRVREVVGRDLGISPGVVVPLSRDEFPKTTSGKIQRTRLKRALAAGAFDERIKQLDLRLANANTVPSWFFVKRWRQVARPARREALRPGPTLVLCDREGLGKALVQALPGPCIRVEPGDGFEQRGQERYAVDPTRPGDYGALVEALVARELAPVRVVHLWHYARQPEPEHELSYGVEAILGLLRALLASGPLGQPPMQLLSVACHSESVAPGEPLRPARAAVQALLQTAAQELPQLDARHVDLEPGEPEARATEVMAELRAPARDVRVVLREQGRLVPGLAPLPVEEPAESRLRPGGFYVITGGLGGVAEPLAAHLQQTLGARLLLVGRTSLDGDPARAHRLRELQARGEVVYAVADVADESAVAHALAQPIGRWGQPDGVFHLAGVFRTAPLAELTPKQLRDELRAKVAGTRVLRAALPDPCRLFVFGSVNAMFGGVTAGAYSAASRYVEALVEAERAAGIETSHCIGWSMWDEIGMSRGYLMKQASRAQGFMPVVPAKGLISMHAVLDRGAAVAYVGLDDSRLRVRHLCDDEAGLLHELAGWYSTAGEAAPGIESQRVVDRFGTPVPCRTTRLAQLPMDAGGSIDDQALLRHDGDATAAPAVEPRTSTERMIVSIWREVLNLDAIDVHANFFELGGQSILLVQVHHRLVQVTGRRLTVVDLLRYPSVAALAKFLDQAQARAPSYERAAQRAQRQKRAQRRRKPRR